MKVSSSGIGRYIIVLLITLFFFYQTSLLDFEAPGGRIGPDAWPMIVLILAALTCIYEIGRRLLFPGAAPEPEDPFQDIAAGDARDDVPEPAMQTAPTYPPLLIGGVVMSIAYVALLGTLGFFLCTALYLAGFIVLGGYRRPVVTAVTSVLGSLVFMFMFMKIVYVSLPLGVEPFAQVSFMLMWLMGIR